MSQLDLISYLLGVASSLAALGVYVAVRHARRAASTRAQARQRRAEAITRAERHEAYKARVRFVPSDQVEGTESVDGPRDR